MVKRVVHKKNAGPAISIVVPVYNVEKWLPGCLRSLQTQTLSDIEIICVDDASTDASADILREAGKKDKRVRVLTFSENRSSSQARKDAVLASRGRYVTFVDGDDELTPDACETMYAMMTEDPVDILNVGTRVLNAGMRSAKDAANTEQRLRPYDGKLFGEDILKCALWDKKYPYSIWAKLIEGNLCRRAFAEVEDGFFPMAQDLYAYCIVAYFARSYRGIPDSLLYRYNYGIGVSTCAALTLEQFRRNCQMSSVCRALDAFFQRQNLAPELYRKIMEEITRSTLQVGVNKWNDVLPARLKGSGLDMLLQHWGPAQVIPLIFGKCRYKLATLAPELADSEVLTPRGSGRPIKTIGILYHSMYLGGVQRVISVLVQYYYELGYEVILFTNQPPHDDDYAVDSRVRRVTLPPDEGNYQRRTEALLNAAREYHLDVMLYHAWGDPLLFWDMLILKSADVRFVVHSHSICSCFCVTANETFSSLPHIFQYADFVVTLSKVDELYYRSSGVRAGYLMNSLTFEPAKKSGTAPEVPTLLWVGRISWEKRPLDAVRILAQVIKTIPEARLRIVGQEKDGDALTRQLKALIEQEKLTKKVELCGFQEDVAPYYRSATLMLNTSFYEGYPGTFVEAFLSGLPVVSYQMPYLEVVRNNRGWVGVASGDIPAAATALTDILSDPARLDSLRKGARKAGKRLLETDIRRDWRKVFRQLEHGYPAGVGKMADREEDLQLLLETIRSHYRFGVTTQRSKYDALNRSYTETKNELAQSRKKVQSAPETHAVAGTAPNPKGNHFDDRSELQQILLVSRGGAVKVISRTVVTGGRLLAGMLVRPRRTARLIFDLYTITDSGLFDSCFYLRAHDDLNRSWTVLPSYHFCSSGWHQGCNPSAFFDVGTYLSDNPDVDAKGCNPLVHYIRHGHREGRLNPR